MSRCRCNSECLCLITGLGCIEVTGSGSVGSPYQAQILLSADPTNKIECREDGLYAGDGITVYTAESECVTIEGNGDEGTPLQALLVVDPDADNLVACGEDGVGAFLNTDDSDTVALSGAGTAADPLIAEIAFNPGAENMAEDSSGLFVSRYAHRYETRIISATDSPFVADYNYAIVVDKSGGDVGITLPGIGGPVSDGASVLVRVQWGASNTCAIYATGGADIDDNGTGIITVPASESVLLVACNGDWFTFANGN